MDISNINGISTGDIKSFFKIPLLRKLTRLIHFLMYFLLPWEASVRQMICRMQLSRRK